MTSTGSGNLPSTSTQLAIVGDADELAAGPGDDLLARQRAAAALDQLPMCGLISSAPST
jgi:hypothetical protein